MTKGRYNGTLSSSATTIRSPSWSSPPVTLNSRFELSRTSMVFSSFAWQAPGTAGEASFTISPRPSLEASGSFHASAEIPALARMLHAPELRAWNLQLEGQAVYQGGTISAQGRAQARQMIVFTPDFPALRLDATSSYALENHRLNLSNLFVSIWGGTVQGAFDANFGSSPPTFRLDTQLHQVRLDSALNAASTPPLLTAQLHPASIAAGAISAKWSGHWEGLKVGFDLSLQAPAAASPHQLSVSGSARGTLEDGRGVIVHLASSEFHTPHSHITAHGTLTQKSVSPAPAEPLTLTVTTDDFEEWRPFFQSLVPTLRHPFRTEVSPRSFPGNLAAAPRSRPCEGA